MLSNFRSVSAVFTLKDCSFSIMFSYTWFVFMFAVLFAVLGSLIVLFSVVFVGFGSLGFSWLVKFEVRSDELELKCGESGN